MPISDHDRRVLWGRSGNRCAICRKSLVEEKTASDREALVGQEAHIVARRPGGPRGGLLATKELDKYDNLILLCASHHEVVDSQPGYYTRERLHRIKAEHERWVEDSLDADAMGPTEIVEDPSAPPLHLRPLRTGDDVWPIIEDVHSYALAGPADGEASPDACEAADAFLQLAHGWGEVSDEVSIGGIAKVREAKRSLEEGLERLRAQDLIAFGGRDRKLLRGGSQPPSAWRVAVIEVVQSDDERIVAGRPPTPEGSADH